MTYIYIASPYSHLREEEQERRYYQVMSYCTWLIHNTEFTPYSPILHCHEWAKQATLPGDAIFWERHNLAMLRGADSIHVLNITGAAASRGIAKEIVWAQALNKGIYVAQLTGVDGGYEYWQTNIYELASILR